MVDEPPARMIALDGMRGIAALIVVVHHAGPMMGHVLLPRGYLAVDFFFMLSGFVMSRTYEVRFREGLRAGTFLFLRLRRLYPAIAISLLIGAGVAVLSGAAVRPTLWLLAGELMFLPTLDTSAQGVFRLVGPQWSLLFELIANFVHSIALHRLTNKTLSLGAALAGLVLIFTAYRFGSLAVGDVRKSFVAGIPRVLFAYIAGMILARLFPVRSFGAAKWGGWSILSLGVVLIAASVVPGGAESWWVDVLTVFLMFPPLIIWASRAQPTGSIAAMAQGFGDLSYPLYTVHLPAMGLVVLGFRDPTRSGAIGLVIVLIAALAAGRILQQLVGRWSPRKPSRDVSDGSHHRHEAVTVFQPLVR